MTDPIPNPERRRFRRYLLALIATALLILVASVWFALLLFPPTPPRTLVMTTGAAGSAFEQFGKRYREALAQSGIELRLVPSAGAIENLTRLNDPRSDASIGFIEGGTTSPDRSPHLMSLGTLFYEPLWFFYRDVDVSKGMAGFRGKRISIGPEGSGTRVLTLELLARNGIGTDVAELLPYAPQIASDKLLSGEIQAAIILTSWESPVVRKLIASPEVHLVSFPRADAYTALSPYLTKLMVPAGVGDLARNLPPKDSFLVATTASLVAREGLHPAIQYLLIDAAMKIHSRPGIFQKAAQFPAPESVDLPLSDKARQFYKSGAPFLQRYLPFWLAVLVGQLLVLAIPVIGVLYPLLRVAPALYGWGMRRRIFRLYGELKFLEAELEARGSGKPMDDLTGRLDRLEDRALHLRVPVAFTHMIYTLRVHIGLAREQLRKEGSGARVRHPPQPYED
jgi:TRAP-type uncharacterized transport system substrate-binding protein